MSSSHILMGLGQQKSMPISARSAVKLQITMFGSNKMKLIKVTVEVELVMCVPDDNDQVDIFYIKDALDDTLPEHYVIVSSEKISSKRDFPSDWDVNSVPYAGNKEAWDMPEMTTGQILGEI